MAGRGCKVAFFYRVCVFYDDRRWCDCSVLLLSTACLCCWSMKRLSKQEKDICGKRDDEKLQAGWCASVCASCFLVDYRVEYKRAQTCLHFHSFRLSLFALPQLSSYVTPPLIPFTEAREAAVMQHGTNTGAHYTLRTGCWAQRFSLLSDASLQ